MCPITTRHRLGVVASFLFYSLQESRRVSVWLPLSSRVFFVRLHWKQLPPRGTPPTPTPPPPSAPTSILRRPASQVHGSTTARKPTSNGELVDFQLLKGTAVPFYCGRRSRRKQRELSRKTRLVSAAGPGRRLRRGPTSSRKVTRVVNISPYQTGKLRRGQKSRRLTSLACPTHTHTS